MKNLKVLIVIPAFNEERSIKSATKKLYSLYPDIDIVIINDGSHDNTLIEAKKTNARIINLIQNIGIGATIQTGFKYANANNYDVMIQFDGDNQHPAEAIKTMVENLPTLKTDIFIGSRFLNSDGFKTTALRMPGIKILSKLLTFLTGQTITDPTSGFRAFSKKAIKTFSKLYPQNYPEPEVLMVAKRYNLKITEFSVNMHERKEGKSSIGFLKGLHYMFTVIFNILLERIRFQN